MNPFILSAPKEEMPEASGHWYRRDGSACHSVPAKDGTPRGINIRWDRGLNLVPSVTTVLQVISKPALEKWKQDQMILAALTLERLPEEPDSLFLKRLREDGFKSASDAAKEGTAVHDALEQYFKGEVYPAKYTEHCKGVDAEIKRLFPDVTDWAAEVGFAHPLGFGGRVDLHSPSIGCVVDFKGKEGDFTDGKTLAYDQHYQLAAYQMGLNLPKAEAANIFFSRTHPGVVKGHKWTLEKMETGRQIFLKALELWGLVKNYDPSFKLFDKDIR